MPDGGTRCSCGMHRWPFRLPPESSALSHRRRRAGSAAVIFQHGIPTRPLCITPDRPTMRLSPTVSGGAITSAFTCLAIVLMLCEWWAWSSLPDSLVAEVDRVDLGTPLPVQLDVTFPRAPCSALGLALAEATGENPLGSVGHKIFKTRLTGRGKPIGREPERLWEEDRFLLGGERPLDSEIEADASAEVHALQREFEAAEGCRISGTLQAPRVTAALHITTALHSEPALYYNWEHLAKIDMSHEITTLRFGETPWTRRDRAAGMSALRTLGSLWGRKKAPQAAPLEGVANNVDPDNPGSFRYFLSVFSLRRHRLTGSTKRGNRADEPIESTLYAFREFFQPELRSRTLPSLVLRWDFAPIALRLGPPAPQPGTWAWRGGVTGVLASAAARSSGATGGVTEGIAGLATRLLAVAGGCAGLARLVAKLVGAGTAGASDGSGCGGGKREWEGVEDLSGVEDDDGESVSGGRHGGALHRRGGGFGFGEQAARDETA